MFCGIKLGHYAAEVTNYMTWVKSEGAVDDYSNHIVEEILLG